MVSLSCPVTFEEKYFFKLLFFFTLHDCSKLANILLHIYMMLSCIFFFILFLSEAYFSHPVLNIILSINWNLSIFLEVQ